MNAVPLTLWDAFVQAAEAAPDRPALVFEEATVSFSALRKDAERIAQWLASARVGRGDVVAIQLPKRHVTYALWLACLRQGAIYVFLDPRNPPVRTASILKQLKPRVFLTVGDDENPFGETHRLDDSTAEGWLAALPAGGSSQPAPVHGLDPAYIMFTSGSTGEPKGAVIPQQGVLSLMAWVRRSILPQGEARFSNINPLHFDNAVFDLYGGLLNGATLVPVETSDAANPLIWVKKLRAGRASVIFAVPTLFQTLQQLRLLSARSMPDARVFVFGGEGFPPAALKSFRAAFDDATRLVNVYGPTETSCICSSLEIDAAALAAAGEGFASLGRMHSGFDHLILDEDEMPVETGATGELWIGGANVGLGYVDNADETARRFRQNPTDTRFRSMWYRTGDLVREDRDGLLWFAGRVDNQVKVRGHRIELEEIDLALEALAGVTRAATVTRPGPDGPQLCAAYSASGPVSDETLRSHCMSRLPPYMRPERFLALDVLPQNANGKVNRKAVAALFRADN